MTSTLPVFDGKGYSDWCLKMKLLWTFKKYMSRPVILTHNPRLSPAPLKLNSILMTHLMGGFLKTPNPKSPD